MDTNRWELPNPVEFPLGQLYSNTSYPDGFNFNLRPWITGHTYQNYGYESGSVRLIFTGRPRNFYLYDPEVGDWTGLTAKPRGMIYDGCFYTLTVCPTPCGLVAWTQQGRLFRLDATRKEWKEMEQKEGNYLVPSSITPRWCLTKRNRLVLWRGLRGQSEVRRRIAHIRSGDRSRGPTLAPGQERGVGHLLPVPDSLRCRTGCDAGPRPPCRRRTGFAALPRMISPAIAGCP